MSSIKKLNHRGTETQRRSQRTLRAFSASLCLCGFLLSVISAQDVDKQISEAEAKRIAVIEKVRPSVVAIFGKGGQGGGSGVLISKDGYALTNFHVVQTGPIMQCGLPNGVLYDAVTVGLDPVGDVALIKLLPKEQGKDFPFAAMGDSDKVRPGDWSLAMGNPFLLATDFTPTVTFGVVSGTHRYQYPSGTILEYTDCIQVDTSINPGNSGGPLFNMAGEIIGINGRISLEKRGRVNSGVGYAISINQIKNFMGHLRAGLVTDHATLGAFVQTDEEGRMIVQRIIEDCDAHRRGLTLDDELVYFAGRPIQNVNQFKNVLGIYPKGWRLPLVYRRRQESGQIVTREILVRLMGVQPQLGEPRIELDPGDPRQPPRPRPNTPPRPAPSAPPGDSPAAKLYEAKTGFANHYFNKLERERVWKTFSRSADFSKLTGAWSFQAEQEKPQKAAVQATFDEQLVKMRIGENDFSVEPLKVGEAIENLREPKGSGGLLVALYHWRRLLTQAEKGFEAGFAYGGYEPFYPKGTAASRIDTEVLNTEHGGVPVKWFFSPKDQTLLGFECYVEKDHDPCEVIFSDYKEVEGRKLPHRIEVRYGDKEFGAYAVKAFQMTDSKESK